MIVWVMRVCESIESQDYELRQNYVFDKTQ